MSAETLRSLIETPLDPDERMDAYYYSFERTGIAIVDAAALRSAVSA